MTRFLRRLQRFLLPAALLAGGAAAKADWYVSPTGDDGANGARRHPFASLERARRAAREAGPGSKPRVIWLTAGVHHLQRTLELTPADSGTASSPIFYRGVPGEEVVLSGAVPLRLDWRPFRDGILQAQVSADSGDPDQLFLDGRRQTLARYPNFDPKAQYLGGTAADALSPARLRTWADPTTAFVHGLHKLEWGGIDYRIAGLNPDGTAKLEGEWGNNRRSGLHERHRFVENVLEELDAPGEWFFDRRARTLYLYPPAGFDPAKARLEGARLRELVAFRGASETPVRCVRFEGLRFTQTARTFTETSEPLLRSDWTIARHAAVFMEGAEDCAVEDCRFDQVGGNAVFLSGYNRRDTIARCEIVDAGASGVVLAGKPGAVRSPSFEYAESIPLDRMDLTPGPRSAEYPADCRVVDCLMHGLGRLEIQVAGVEIAMCEGITVSHCSIYDLPRAAINVGDGCWGGHVIEFNDLFDTVKQSGDHGSFNSWGRDRYWLPNYEAMVRQTSEHPDLALLDTVKPITLRNNRWRCDHGWDIDLDDGSTHYVIENNLCLKGGLKLREGFHRRVENNVMVGNSFHPHVWFPVSHDVFRHNIVMTWYQPIGMPKRWGDEVDFNLLPSDEALGKSHALGLDAHSLSGDPQFINPSQGDYRVKPGSPALAAGFRNFPMDQFGVVSPNLRRRAKTPFSPPSPE